MRNLESGYEADNEDEDVCDICHAITRNQIIKVSELIKEKRPLNYHDECGYYPIHYAVGLVEVEITKLLVNNGVKINVTDKKNGDTPLHIAAKYERVDTIQLLLEKGADTKIRNKNGQTFVDIIKQSHNMAVRSTLYSLPPNPETSKATAEQQFCSDFCNICAIL